MHEATCLKNVHVTSDIKEHVTQWSILDKKNLTYFVRFMDSCYLVTNCSVFG